MKHTKLYKSQTPSNSKEANETTKAEWNGIEKQQNKREWLQKITTPAAAAAVADARM